MIRQFDTEMPEPDAHSDGHRLAMRRLAEDIDRHVGGRIRERRIMLGLTHQQLAEIIGVTLQQAYKYENGINRVASGRLYQIAQALDTDVGYFFEVRDHAFSPTPQQRLLREFTRNFMAIPDRKLQEQIVSLARALAEPDVGPIPAHESRRVGAC